MTPDCVVKCEDYLERCKELQEPNYFTTNHGSGGDIFDSRSKCDKAGIHCKFGIEGYIVPDPLEKDKSNYHIIMIPRTNVARKKLNLASSRANEEGFYFKPRFFVDDLVNNFDEDELYITTACIAGLLKDEESVKGIFAPLYKKFHENLYLEVQSHNVESQKALNERALKLSDKLGLKLIAANDSHYIYPEQSKDRDFFLKGKGIDYGNENEFILDYPNYDTFAERFQKQGMLTDAQIEAAIDETLVFDKCEDIEISTEIKMPTILPDKNDEEKIAILKHTVNKRFKDMVKRDNIPEEKVPLYKSEIEKEFKVIEDTSEVHTADYFILNYVLMHKAIDNYGGVLTRSGRGSCGAYMINKVLGITQIDRLATSLPLYSERFMSTARVLGNRSLPDIDANVVDQEPFIKASKELLGERGCYPMIAYGTMEENEAFRNVCRAAEIPFDKYNEVGKNIDKHRNSDKWGGVIQEADKYTGTIISKSPHPCSFLLYNGDIREEVGVMKVKDKMCAMITSSEADEWKYLKNDYLVVTVWDIISQTFKKIRKPILTVNELLSKLDDKVWNLFADGLTATLNQVDGDWATSLVKKYKPQTMEELAMFIASIRPGFNSFRDDFIARKPYSTGSKQLDEVLKATDHYVLFQENLMQYFEWLGVTPAESIGLIKKISKKKIKQSDFDDLTERLHEGWMKQVGSEEGFESIWAAMQSMISYSFNCLSGDNKIYRDRCGRFAPTIEEMYNIRNDRQYAKETGHLVLHAKYHAKGYGKTLSLCEDGRIRENRINDICYIGERETYNLVTKSGKYITCTDNHKFPTPNGKKMLKELKVGDVLYCKGKYEKAVHNNYPLTNGDFENNFPKKGEQGFQSRENGDSVIFDRERGGHVNNRDCCEICGRPYSDDVRFEVHHKDLDRTNNSPENYQWLCVSCHKKEHYKNGRTKKYEKGIPSYLDEIVSIEPKEKQRVYNVSMDDPYHNFVVNNGLVTSNSPHGEAYAIDCLYCAYLKANFPYEYYTVVLNAYIKDQDKTNRLIGELEHFGIKVSSIKFRHSQAEYTINKNEHTIYKGMSSIKYLNKRVSRELYEMRNDKFGDFIDLLTALENTHTDSRQLEILIKLDFFSEFGEIQTLLHQSEIYDMFKGRKTLKITEVEDLGFNTDDLPDEVFSGATMTEKTIKNVDSTKLIKYLCANRTYPETTILQKIAYESECLGYINITVPGIDKRYCYVMNVDGKYSSKLITLYRLSTGDIEKIKVKGKAFNNKPIKENSIIKTMKKADERKWRKDAEGKFYQIDETEPVLKEWGEVQF